jgi:hypothetical protein
MSGAPRYLTFNSYLRGVFGEKVYKISVDAGFTCPNRDGKISTGGCVFCDNSAFTPAKGGSIAAQIEEGKKELGARSRAQKFIAYFQPHTNTYAPAARLDAVFREALAQPGVAGLAIGTRPDCVPEETLALLERLAKETHVWLEYGMQSSNDATLKRINRGHGSAEFVDAVKRTKGRGIKICAHVIFGLPGETRADMLRTVQLCADLKIDGIKFHHLHVVRGTALEKMYARGEASVFSLEEYVNLLSEAIEMLPPDMVVQRLFGWADAAHLVAPDWGMSRQEIQQVIERYFEEHDIRQGRKYKEI